MAASMVECLVVTMAVSLVGSTADKRADYSAAKLESHLVDLSADSKVAYLAD